MRHETKTPINAQFKMKIAEVTFLVVCGALPAELCNAPLKTPHNK